ncbi:MAG: polymer-forming cytoskeletal protein [Massilibacteroides sp.]|nr:polymer-forming cytoskeletal protein [Massilibacteroides sp.]MDD3062523.1 polymer-forming cytoskeletal protein [Massilibacteroides sp.]MDD4115532.1 polymer-forming cytoskeletal protein [Massilibacteroides sp.]MDD4660331.1 polymer-forming cytoskeletal protein [Massilibacteroides sp.]
MTTQPFQKKVETAKTSQAPTLIGEGSIFYGDIKYTQAIRIEGTLVGNVTQADSVVVGITGSVKGTVNTSTLVVFGYIDGDVSASESIVIKESGKVAGKLSTRSLAVERGALYEGKIEMVDAE